LVSLRARAPTETTTKDPRRSARLSQKGNPHGPQAAYRSQWAGLIPREESHATSTLVLVLAVIVGRADVRALDPAGIEHAAGHLAEVVEARGMPRAIALGTTVTTRRL
jgi:hypothetical protein